MTMGEACEIFFFDFVNRLSRDRAKKALRCSEI